MSNLDPVQTVLAKLDGVKQTGPAQWQARCPAHNDKHASLSIGRGDDGRALVRCHAGCALADVLAKIGLKDTDLFAASADAKPPVSPAPKAKKSRTIYETAEEAFAAAGRQANGQFVSAWQYPGDSFRVARFALAGGGKTFRPIHRLMSRGAAGWSIGDPAGLLPLYRGDTIGDVGPVVNVEGEKCADAAASVGLAAVTSAHGAKSAGKSDWQPLAGREVIILPDNDDSGRQYAQEVATILNALTPPAVVKIVELPGLADGGDIADWIAADGPMGDRLPEEIRERILSLADAAPAWTPKASAPASGPVLVCMADVKPEPVRWLWPSRFAIGKLTMLAGDPGLGKSFITLDMAARVSRGDGWPDSPASTCAPGGVVLLSAEDDLADTIRPRLDMAKADVTRIRALTTVRIGIDPASGKPIFAPFNLAQHLPMLEGAIRQVADCRLVIIDPISAYLGGTDSHKNADVRGLLAPMTELAARYGVSIVAVNHLRKGEGPAMYRTMGSLGFIAAARAAYAFSKDNDDPTGSRRFMLPIKNNVGNDKTGLAYRLLAGCGGIPAVAWEPDPVSMSVDDALRNDDHAGGKDDGGTERQEAVAWLRAALAAGPVEARNVYDRAQKDGIAKRTLDRAKHDLRVIAYREGFGADGSWRWKLPQAPDDGGQDGQAIDCPPVNGQGPTPETVATFGEGGNLWEKPKENGDSGHAQDAPEPKDCQAPESGNVCPDCPAGRLDPDTPGPVDLLPKDRLPTYRAVYSTRPASMSPAEKHARAWRAALRPE